MTQDQDLKKIMKQLGRAVVMAISSSEDINALVGELRRKGMSLSLALSCEPEDPEADSPDGQQETELQLIARKSLKDPAFRLDGQDVSILKAMGIDPTRAAPRRKSSS